MSTYNFENGNNSDFYDSVVKEGFDYIDFGCSKGGSLAFAQKRFDGKRGMGIDIASAKVDATRKAGFDAICFDIHKIPDKKLVRFVTMSHFLEHVPNHQDVKSFIRKACLISKEFVYIQQPFFDSDGYLFNKGFKLFWSDWLGHPNRMTSLELFLILRDLKDEGLPIRFSIHAYRPIKESDDECIHPLASPVDQHEYKQAKHPGKKSGIVFEVPIFYELIALITMSGVDHEKMLDRIRYHRTLFDSEGGISSGPGGFKKVKNKSYEIGRKLRNILTSFRQSGGSP